MEITLLKVGRSKGVDIADGQFHVRHILGYLYELKPSNTFVGIKPGGNFVISFLSAGWSVARTDQFPNWYIASPKALPRILECTKSEELDFVGLFDTPKKWKRSQEDMYDSYTPDRRFVKHKVYRM